MLYLISCLLCCKYSWELKEDGWRWIDLNRERRVPLHRSSLLQPPLLCWRGTTVPVDRTSDLILTHESVIPWNLEHTVLSPFFLKKKRLKNSDHKAVFFTCNSLSVHDKWLQIWWLQIHWPNSGFRFWYKVVQLMNRLLHRTWCYKR